ncbi:hypothetical protein V6N12_005817 [Hibiscus sabdariffa]|uniref:Uncharacterized protein n=1 Tax=Hibiscus sabdariffa TaxID=183260 RepID=A0ABR2AW77_9ROSI
MYVSMHVVFSEHVFPATTDSSPSKFVPSSLEYSQPLHIVPNDNTIGAATSASSFADVIGSSSDSSQSASSQSASLVSSTPGIQESDLALHSHDLAMESDLQHNAAIESMSHGSAPTLPDQEAVLQGRSMSSVALEGVTLTEESNSQSGIHREESAHTTIAVFVFAIVVYVSCFVFVLLYFVPRGHPQTPETPSGGPCKFMELALNDMAAKFTDVEFVKLDFDEIHDLFRGFHLLIASVSVAGEFLSCGTRIWSAGNANICVAEEVDRMVGARNPWNVLLACAHFSSRSYFPKVFLPRIPSLSTEGESDEELDEVEWKVKEKVVKPYHACPTSNSFNCSKAPVFLNCY